MKHLLISIIVLICLGACQGAISESEVSSPIPDTEAVDEASEGYSLIWEWEGEFDSAEQTKLKEWIQEVYDATVVTLGQYQFDVHVIFERAESERPVSFGLASRRGGKSSVRFYVNPEASKEDLLADWTAPHELSHLAIPFIGNNSKWFSEGFATFLSRQTMMEMGYYTQEEFDEIYEEKIARNKKYYGSNTMSFVEVSDSLMANYLYGAMYDGSTSYFLTMDKRLREEKGMRFIDVVKEYQICCREGDRSLRDVIDSFDQVIEEDWFSVLMRDYRKAPSIEVVKNY